MTITRNRTIEKVFQGAAILAFSLMLLSVETAIAQSSAFVQPVKQTASEPAALQANIFASADPLVLKVIFVNPQKETVTLLVKKDGEETVYARKFENTENYNSRVDVSGLPDGNYMFQIIGTTTSFSETFQISTQTARLTYIH